MRLIVAHLAFNHLRLHSLLTKREIHFRAILHGNAEMGSDSNLLHTLQ